MSGSKAAYDASIKNLLANKQILAWILKCCVPEFADREVMEIAAQSIIGEPQISRMPVFPDETGTQGGGTKSAAHAKTKSQNISTKNTALARTKTHRNPNDAVIMTPKIQNAGVEDVTITEGTVMFDIRFQVLTSGTEKQCMSMLVDVEAQNDFYPGYPLAKRGIYYCGRMISSQYNTVFTKAHYEKLKKVYSIWICASPSARRKNTVSVYSMTENNLTGSYKEKPQNYNLQTMVLICLGNPDGTSVRGSRSDAILRLLNVLLSSEITPAEKISILEREFSIPMTEKIKKEVNHMCNLSDGIERKGIQKGRREGRREGRKEGRRDTRKEDIRNLMCSLKLTAEQAMEALRIPRSEQAMYAQMLKER